LESNVALLRAASGLEKLMVGTPGKTILKDSTVAQISAALYYQANVMANLVNNKQFKKLFQDTIYNQILKDFGAYIDAKARTSPKSFHHVYEWNKVGVKSHRLFKLKRIKTAGLGFGINYEFISSKSFVPESGGRRHVFINKASVMEEGKPLTIFPRYSSRLVFEINGDKVFMPPGKSVTIKRPGGSGVKNQFSLAYNRFFNGNLVNESIRKSGFEQIFNAKTSRALKIPGSIRKINYSFSPNTVRREAEAELAAQFGGVMV
jgi:hypothetical protein